MRRGLRTAVLGGLALWLASAAPWADPGGEECAGYLAVRERLAPMEVVSERALRWALTAGGAPSVEFIGDINGMASSAASVSGELPRTLMMTLDDGSNVTLRAGEEAERLRVGDRVAVIASISREAPSCGDLVMEACVREWELPPREDEEPVEAEGTQEEGAGGPAQRLPSPQATSGGRVDAVERWQAWVLEHNPRLTEQQARDIVNWVLYYAQQHDVNHKLIFALIKWESWFDPSCVSHAGAIGLMQLMPGTARSLGVDPWKVQQNIEGGVRYLAEQLAEYRDRPNYERVILALACYNAGPNAVARAGHRVPGIPETQRYVRKVSSTFHELDQSGMP